MSTMNSVVTPVSSAVSRRRQLLREYFLNALTLALLKEGKTRVPATKRRVLTADPLEQKVALPS